MSNVDVIKTAYAAFARGDVAAVLGAMDPAIEWHQAEGNPYMPSGNAWVGPDAIATNLFARLGADWDAFAVHPNTYYDAGDTVVVEARYTGTYRGKGRSQNTQVCHVWGFRSGKIIRFQQYADTAQLQDVMGARLGT
jgi:ketosteroid isomerase-like protein